jgi:hypothetical protein
VISDVSQRLAGLDGYLAETIPLKEMEFKDLPLFRGHFFSQPVQQGFARNLVYGYLPPGRWRSLFVEFLNIVVVTHIQVSSAVDGALVGHLNDPRCARTLLGIKKPRLLEEKEKKFLEQILSLAVSILRQSRRLYGCWPLKGAFSQPLKAKASATAKATKCKNRAYFRNCQTFGSHPGKAGGLPFLIHPGGCGMQRRRQHAHVAGKGRTGLPYLPERHGSATGRRMVP